jgi:hypothetical protein
LTQHDPLRCSFLTMQTASTRDDPGYAADTEGDIDLLRRRLLGGWLPSAGLALVAASIGALLALVIYWSNPPETFMRVQFSFPGIEAGKNPDGSAFMAEGLRAPDVVAAALKGSGLPLDDKAQAAWRNSLNVVGLVPPQYQKKEADATRNTYFPDEYLIACNYSDRGGRDIRVRERFLHALFSAYRDRFRRTYSELPFQFGTVFASLQSADYYEYELLLNQDLRDIRQFLAKMRESAVTFRSPTTQLSFADLETQTAYFERIKLNQALGLIQSTGMTKDRKVALIKMDYYLRLLNEEERRDREEESLVRNLMDRLDQRSQSYVMTASSQIDPTRSTGPVVDRQLLESLLKTDAYNFLVRKALEAGTRARQTTARKEELSERFKRMEAFSKAEIPNQTELRQQVDQALTELKVDYQRLTDAIRQTYSDYAEQASGGGLRISVPPTTKSVWRPFLLCSALGAGLGLGIGVGLSLLGVFERRRAV